MIEALQGLDAGLQLSVADTGVGIPAEDLPKVFEEFHQLEQRPGQQQGSGLGLAIAQKTVELLGGEISVESEVGSGTRFTVRLTDYGSGPRFAKHFTRENAMKPIALLTILLFLALSCTSPEPEETPSPDLITFTQFTTDSADDSFPAWSPDGQWIAFVSHRKRTGDIFIQSVTGGEVIQLTEHPATDWAPRWSPDGTKLLFVSDRGGMKNLWTVSAFEDESTLVQITTDADSLDGNMFDWSPTGDEIVFTSKRTGNWDLWVLPVAGGPARQVTDSPAQDWDPGWSRDGQWIAYNSSRTIGVAADLWVAPASGGAARQLTTGSKGDFNPRWSPDDQWITFSSMRGGDWGIWVIPAAGGRPLEVAHAGFRSLNPDWSPDGKRIVSFSNPTVGDLWILPLESMQPRRVVEGAFGADASWSPDGREVAYISMGANGWNVWKTSVSGGDRVQLTEGGGIMSGFATWSPDGRHIAFCARHGQEARLFTVSADGGEPDQVTIKLSGRRGATWSPDSRQIAFAASIDADHDIWVVPASGGTSERLLAWPGIEVAPDWSPDGTMIAFTSSTLKDGNKGTYGTWNIWLLPVNGSKPGSKPGSEHGSKPGGDPVWLTEGGDVDWSPDGSQLCFTHEGDIWKIPFSGGSPIRLMETPQIQESYPRWSPDGSQILYSTGSRPNIWIADVSRLLASR